MELPKWINPAPSQGTVHLGGQSAPHDGEQTMESDAKNGEAAPKWRRPQGGAQETQKLESVVGAARRSGSVPLGIPSKSCRDGVDLSCVPGPDSALRPGEKASLWKRAERAKEFSPCLRWGRETLGGLETALDSPYHPAVEADFSKRMEARHQLPGTMQPKETPEFQLHSEPKNGEVNISWAALNKDRPGPMWTEAMLASQLALYSHAYHNYPLPLSGLENQSPAATGKPYRLSEQDSLHSASPSGDSTGDPPSFHHLSAHCPFLVEAKLAERNPFLASSIVPASTPAESAYGNSLASLALAHQPQDCPSALGEAQYTDPDWHRAPYPRAWSQPVYLAPHPRTKTPSAFETCSSSGNKEFYQKKDPGFPHTGKDLAPVPDQAQSRMLGQYEMGKVKRDGESEMELTYMEPTRGAEQMGCLALAPPSDQTLPNNRGQMGQPLFYLKHKVAESLWPSQPLVLDYPVSKAPARPSESKDESLLYQSLKAGSLAVLQESSGSPLTDRSHPPALSKVELPSGMEVLPAHALPCKCSPWDCPPRCCQRCQGAGCDAVNSFGTRNELPGPYREVDGALGGRDIQRGKVSSLLPCPPSNHHTKLKKTWLTRHSEQFRCPASCLGDKGAPGQIKEGLPLRFKALKREGQESAEEADRSGKRTAKRPHSHVSGEDLWSTGHSRGCYSAKQSSKAAENEALNPIRMDCEAPERREVCPAMGRNTDAGEGGLLSCNGEDAGEQKEKRYLQSVPCMALPDCIERCCACASKDRTGAVPREEEEEPVETFCRLLHFRRLAFCDSGELSVDGFSTLDEAEGESLCLRISSRERRAQDISTSLSLAKYLLSVLGDQFCEAIRRDREAWLWAQGENERVTAWRRGKGALQACDACQHGLFNAHWSCSSCGFQLCSECYRTKRERASPALAEESVQSAKCVQGQGHDVLSLIPAQFIPTHVLAELWKLMHEVQVKFDIESRCPCRLSIPSKSLTDNTGGGQKEETGSMTPSLQPASNGETDGSRAIKEESPDSVHPPSEQGPKGAVQTTSTLCELLTSTAVRLCLGQNGVRMAFAPVSPALPSDNRITNILDSIIAQVVERKIQEKHSERELRSPSPPEPQVSHCILAPGGLLWLHDPNHSCNYKLFQEHWRQGQPVLVSGLQKTLKKHLWEPESFCREQRGQEVQAVNLRSQPGWTWISSKDFWDGFASSAKCLETENSKRNLLKLESGFGDMPMCRAENLSASLPLLEYCGHDGKLNLASYLPGSQGRQWLSPQICAAYGVASEDRTVGTKNLTVEATDSISVLVYVGAYPLDGHSAQKEILRRVEEDGVDDVLKERLWDTRNWAGALWHVFRAEDADCIKGFLQKVCKAQGQDGAAQLDLNGHRSCYLDASLRRRLREECGVSSWTLLQFLGDAVLVPTGAPHQVQSLSSTISVTQRFLSPENTACSARLAAQATDPAGTAQRLHAQMDSMVYGAVRDAVGTLQGYN